MGREVTCEHGLPVRPDDPFPVGRSPFCRPCWRAMGGTGEVAAADCLHLGERRFVAGSARDWRTCGHPVPPLGEVVCRCQGCGPTCTGYQSAATAGVHS